MEPRPEKPAHAKTTYEVGEPPLIWKVERPTPAAVDGPPPTTLEAAVIWRPSKNNMSKYIPISERLPHTKATYVGGEPPTAAVGGPPPAALEAVVVWRPKRPAHAKTIYEVGELTPAAVNEPPPTALEAAVEWKPNRNNMSGHVPISEGLAHAKTTHEVEEPPPALEAVIVWRPGRSGMSKYIPISNSPTLQANQKDAIMTQIDLVMTSQNQTNCRKTFLQI